MADRREWPGFRVRESWRPRASSVRAAETDVTYPSAAVNKAKHDQKERANEAARASAAGEPLTLQQARMRTALARGETSSLSPHEHVLANVIRFVPGGRNTVIGLVQRAMRNNDPDATAWWNVYCDLLPTDQRHVDLDVVCEAAGIAPDRLMAVVVSTAMRAGADAAELVAATTLPTLIHQTAKSAKRIGGEYASIAQKDREFLLQHHKFIPTPKSGGIFVNANANAQAQAAAASAQSQPSVPTFSESLTGAVDAQRAIQGELVSADSEE